MGIAFSHMPKEITDENISCRKYTTVRTILYYIIKKIISKNFIIALIHAKLAL